MYPTLNPTAARANIKNTPRSQRMRCPDDCNGNGKCLSMRQLALLALDADYVPSPHTYGSIAGDPLTWDADAVFGCFCDWMVGTTGHD